MVRHHYLGQIKQMAIMKIIKKETTLENLTFNIYLTQDIKNLGLSFDLNEDLNTTPVNKRVSYVGVENLKAVRSFDFNTPYVVGVNGVTGVTEDEITYLIDGIKHTTNLTTNLTSKVVEYQQQVYTNNNFIRTDDAIGLIEKPVLDTIEIERNPIGIIETFGKLRQIKNVDEFSDFGNEFYEIFDQTF